MNQAYDDNLILAYVEGDLPPAEQQDFKLALMKDPKLRQLVEQMMADRQALRDMPDEDAPPDLMEAIDQHLERQMLLSPASAQPMASDEDHRRFKFVRIGSFAAMAAMLLLGVGLIYQTFNEMDRPPDTTSRQVASDMDMDMSKRGNASDQLDTPLAMAPREAIRRDTGESVAAPVAESRRVLDEADDRPAVSMRAAPPVAAAPVPLPSAMPRESASEPARALMDMAIAADEAEQPVAQSIATGAVVDNAPSQTTEMLEGQIAAKAGEDRVAALPPSTEPSGIAGSMGMAAGSAPPGMSTAAPGSIAPPAPSALSLFGVADAARPAEPPQNLAIIVTAHEPTKAYEKLLAWCEAHNAGIRFDNPRHTDVDDVAELFAAGERKRVAVTFDAADFPQLLDMFEGSPRIDSSLVREPRGLRNRSMDSINFADLIDRATVVDPGTLELPADAKMTVQVVIRPPWTGHALERPEPAPRD